MNTGDGLDLATGHILTTPVLSHVCAIKTSFAPSTGLRNDKKAPPWSLFPWQHNDCIPFGLSYYSWREMAMIHVEVLQEKEWFSLRLAVAGQAVHLRLPPGFLHGFQGIEGPGLFCPTGSIGEERL